MISAEENTITNISDEASIRELVDAFGGWYAGGSVTGGRIQKRY
jgi:hypothetical protein